MDLEFRSMKGRNLTSKNRDSRQYQHQRQSHPRELAVSPGEVFDMVRVKVSKERLEGLQYFEPGKVELRPERPILRLPRAKISWWVWKRKTTGNVQLGAAFSSIDQIVGFAELNQGNFDLSIRRPSAVAARNFDCVWRSAQCARLRRYVHRAMVSGSQARAEPRCVSHGKRIIKVWTTFTTKPAPARVLDSHERWAAIS